MLHNPCRIWKKLNIKGKIRGILKIKVNFYFSPTLSKLFMKDMLTKFTPNKNNKKAKAKSLLLILNDVPRQSMTVFMSCQCCLRGFLFVPIH